MAGEIVTTEQLRDFLGVDSDRDSEVEALRTSAIESICRATGIDWTKREKVGTFNEAVRTQVWISYYALRDASKNTVFLQEYLSGIINSLQLTRGEEAETDGV
ncbi:MAG TPA: phage gp6-like head-tail connector protein [Clostridiales bacterium]|nr:phage gp6-like head-tail connector protein [Clostridiales bacterium]